MAAPARGDLDMSSSFAPEVIADNTGTWSGNGCRFATREAAENWVAGLACRWLLVTDTRVVESEDQLNQ